MDFVDEQHVAFVEVGDDGSQVASTLDDRPGGGLELHPHLVGDDVGERGLSEAWRTCEEEVIQRLLSTESGLNEDTEVVEYSLLAHVVVHHLRTQADLVAWLLGIVGEFWTELPIHGRSPAPRILGWAQGLEGPP